MLSVQAVVVSLTVTEISSEALSYFCNSRFLTAVAELNLFLVVHFFKPIRLKVAQLAFHVSFFNKEKG